MILDGTQRVRKLPTEAFTRLFLYKKTTDFQVLLYLTIIAGLSFQEVSDLKWKDINMEGDTIHTELRDIHLVPSIKALLKEYRSKKMNEYFDKDMLEKFVYVYCDPDGQKYTEEKLREDFSAYLKEHKVEDLSPEEIHQSYPEELYRKDLVNEVIRQFVTNIRLHPIHQKKWAMESGQI